MLHLLHQRNREHRREASWMEIWWNALEHFTGSIVVPVTMQKVQQQQLPFPKLSKQQILPCSKNMAKLQIADNFFLCLLIVINIWRKNENYTVLTKNSIPSISTNKNVNSKQGRNGWEKFFACTDDTIIKYANVVIIFVAIVVARTSNWIINTTHNILLNTWCKFT